MRSVRIDAPADRVASMVLWRGRLELRRRLAGPSLMPPSGGRGLPAGRKKLNIPAGAGASSGPRSITEHGNAAMLPLS